MGGQLLAQGPLQHPGGQIGQQTIGAQQLGALGVGLLHQAVDQLLVDHVASQFITIHGARRRRRRVSHVGHVA
jgi:hypothetical protein